MSGGNSSSNQKKKLFVVVARHGERWDYLQREAGKGVEWIATNARPWDPPLSPQGLQQASRLGHHLAQKLSEMGLPPIGACYSSPFLRCRQTACQAVEAINKYNNNNNNTQSSLINNGDTKNNLLQVRVELGLSESLNESWYRSWALPDADSTWGFVPPSDKKSGKRRQLHEFQDYELHPASQQPAQALLQWTNVGHAQSPNLETLQDLSYVSSTVINKPFALKPKVLVESKNEQKERMFQVIANKAQPEQTILLVSHGGPVTHLYEKLTGNHWSVHGDSKYCCYSIYECQDPDTKSHWKPLLVNQSQYLDELWSDATANI